MKFFVLALLVLTASATDKHTTKYDNIDLDEILKSERLFKSYANCFLQKGKCTPDGSEMRDLLENAMTKNCDICTEKQKNNTNKMLSFILNNKKEIFDALEKLYDQDGMFKANHDATFKQAVPFVSSPKKSAMGRRHVNPTRTESLRGDPLQENRPQSTNF